MSVLPTSNAKSDTFSINTSLFQSMLKFKRLRMNVCVTNRSISRSFTKMSTKYSPLNSICCVYPSHPHKNATFGILLPFFYVLNVGYCPKKWNKYEECCGIPRVFSVDRTRDSYLTISFMKLSTDPSLNRSRGDIRCVSLDSLCTLFNLSAASCGSQNAEFHLFCQSCSPSCTNNK
jgi:hypothetical protein